MTTRAALVLLLLLAGCTKATEAPAVTAAPKPSAPKLDPGCSLATPLVPGVPGSPGHLIPSARNPNGDSELAALMRTMQADVGAAREAVLKNEVPLPMHPRHQRMRCSWPTEAKDRDATFDAFAVRYLDAVKTFDARKGDAKTAFVGVVRMCKACHEQACPGPLAAIELLQIPDSH